LTTAQALRETAARLIGPCEVIEVLRSAVARISAHNGQEYVIKKHASQVKHDREVHAYRHWTAALGSSAPELVAADTQALTIITPALASQQHPGALTAPAHHRAGALLRRFHDAEPPRRLPAYRDWLRDRSAHWLDRAKPFLAASDLAIVTAHLAVLQEAAIPAGVPCHLDFQARNWLLDRADDLYLIDFEHSRIDIPLRDLVRLRFRAWPARPDLRDAFLAGYGRGLTDADAETLRHLGALDALTALARGHETSDAMLIESGHSTLRQLRET
jgi:hypothetical protein